MQRKLPDLSTTQLIASGVATLTAAVGASFLGVYGTILGAAFMSVASTAGSAVCKHFLDQGKEQLKDLSHLQAEAQQRDAAHGAAADAVSADPTRTVVWSAGDPSATRLDLPLGGDPNATRLDRTPAETVADSLAEAAGTGAVREVVRRSALESTVAWAKANWVRLAVSSAVVFAIVIAGISVYEATTGKPINNHSKGLTVTKVFGGGGGQTHETPSETPSTGRTEPSGSPSDTPSDTPSSDVPSTGPTGGKTGEPSERPSERPTNTPTTSTPSGPGPTKSSGGQNGDEQNVPQGRTTP
ncbi:hypothetical protein [Actinomadura rubrisoli]|uniref:Uncharacterized protein n=1 Tax=Actinomadura rubrisoli TaxID=2530368 RepID=A0A4R5AEU6_9ACTN|nr:hypothetical protein [Actinomadura rubrisoli]TDD70851.1 hypothetical protein E1298_36310 [Actinomadura rubrisoli]